MEILNGKVVRNETNQNAMGGTELLGEELAKRLPQSLLKDFQIISSRVRELDEGKIRIFWAHDLPGDPESEFLKSKDEQAKFHAFVFVSHWQMQRYIEYYGIPWSSCICIRNAINPIEAHEKPDHKEKLTLTYFSTPHRGLHILAPVFAKLAEKHPHIELDVYSSFNLYGWKERDKPFEKLFEMLDAHPRINNYGSVSNDVIRESLTKTHILAYPSIWQETSCLVLMESMSAGLVCVHPNFAALPETATEHTVMYQYQDRQEDHANLLYHVLNQTIEDYDNKYLQGLRRNAKAHADTFYTWERRAMEWNEWLSSIRKKVGNNRGLPKGETFVYNT